MSDPFKPTGPEYKADVVWKLDVQYEFADQDAKRYGQYLYIITGDTGGNEFEIVKVDLETGRKVWTSPTIDAMEGSRVIKIGDNLFVQEIWYRDNVLYCFDDATGKLKATIRLFEEKVSMSGNMLPYKNYLFWGCDGLLRLNIDDIDFTKEATEEQLIIPTEIWDGGILKDIETLPVESEGIIYALTDSIIAKGLPDSEGKNCELVALDAETGSILWLKEFIPPKEDSVTVVGMNEEILHIEGENIFVIDSALGCYNKKTGEVVFEVIKTAEEIENTMPFVPSAYSKGVVYFDEKIYYYGSRSKSSSKNSGIPEKYNKNVLCISAKDGSNVWGAMPEHSGALWGRPNVINGKVFVFQIGYIFVYNAQTGNLIGIMEDDVHFMEVPTSYKNMLVYLNSEGILTAIRVK